MKHVLRKIFGPVQNEEEIRRMRRNFELKKKKKNADSEISKQQKNGLAGSRDEDGRKKNT
jgi:hypothetical protein